MRNTGWKTKTLLHGVEILSALLVRMNLGCVHAEQVDRTMSQFMHMNWSAKDGIPDDVYALAHGRISAARDDAEHLSSVLDTFVWTLEVCLFLALACSCAAAFGSDRTIAQFAHTAWGPKDGAPSVVAALAQSTDGYLWLGSPDGLYRFDREVLESYQPQSGGPFPTQDVNSLLALPNGDLWIGFTPGVVGLLRNGSVTNYTIRDGVPGRVWPSHRIGRE